MSDGIEEGSRMRSENPVGWPPNYPTSGIGLGSMSINAFNARQQAERIEYLEAESVRLREQLEAVRALPEMAWDHRHLDAAGGQGARGYNEALRVVKAILEAK